DFYSEDRQGSPANREEFVKNLIDFHHSVRITKRLIAEESKDHSFCLDFEEVEGGKNQINLFECRGGKLTRVYAFRGVPEDAKLVYHDYLNDPEGKEVSAAAAADECSSSSSKEQQREQQQRDIRMMNNKETEALWFRL
ncbi:hypothetical protein, conserved, partial [Eimeria acervulina]